MNKSHLSVVFIPFQIKDLSVVRTEIEKIAVKGNFSFFDSSKYHKYIENLICNPFKDWISVVKGDLENPDNKDFYDKEYYFCIGKNILFKKEKGSIVKIEKFKIASGINKYDENEALFFDLQDEILVNLECSVKYLDWHGIKEVKNGIKRTLNNDNRHSAAFLNIYKVDTKYSGNVFDLDFNSQNKFELKIDDKWSLRYSTNTYVVINEFANIGYFVLGIEYLSKNELTIADFSGIEFFRFYNNNSSRYKIKTFAIRKEYSSLVISNNEFQFNFKRDNINFPVNFNLDENQKEIKLEQQNGRSLFLKKEDINGSQTLFLKDSKGKVLDCWENIEQYRDKSEIKDVKSSSIKNFTLKNLIEDEIFSAIKGSIDIKIEKPILLHLFFEKSSEIQKHKELEYILYNTLRIKSSSSSPHTDVKTDLLTTTYSGVSICTLPEGAAIIDATPTHPADVFNKYFAAFMIVLNQREVMIDFNEKLSNLNYDYLEDALTLKEDTNAIVKKLKELKRKIELFKLKQVIYSVSFYDEIVLFYKKLFNSFDVKTLLEDNQQSVSEIYTLLADIEKQKEEEQREIQKKAKEYEDKKNEENNKRLNNILLVLTIAQVWAILSDFFKDCSSASIDTYLMIVNICAYVVFLIFILLTFFNKK